MVQAHRNIGRQVGVLGPVFGRPLPIGRIPGAVAQLIVGQPCKSAARFPDNNRLCSGPWPTQCGPMGRSCPLGDHGISPVLRWVPAINAATPSMSITGTLFQLDSVQIHSGTLIHMSIKTVVFNRGRASKTVYRRTGSTPWPNPNPTKRKHPLVLWFFTSEPGRVSRHFTMIISIYFPRGQPRRPARPPRANRSKSVYSTCISSDTPFSSQ